MRGCSWLRAGSWCRLMPWGQGGPSGSVLEKKQNSGVRGEGRKESPLCLSDLRCREEEPVS